MLNIIVKSANNNHINSNIVVNDIEKLFSQIKIKGTEIDKLLIREIEQGEYIDGISYKDRFGYKLHYEDMSNGCKAALCVANAPEKIIDLLECGNNARDIIISVCKKGNIIIEDNGVTFKKYADTIDVLIDGYNITSVERLNRYIQDERPFKPDMSIGGIKSNV